jgi:hypothetical protein
MDERPSTHECQQSGENLVIRIEEITGSDGAKKTDDTSVDQKTVDEYSGESVA